MTSRQRKRKNENDIDVPSSSQGALSSNYYQPRQSLTEEDKANDDNNNNVNVQNVKKINIPPITVLKSTSDVIHEICKKTKVNKYSIRKISIGHKLFCELQYDYDSVSKYLKENKIEYFSYTSKNNRPYKVVLSGLDKTDATKIKSDLINAGLKCLDVKPVFRKTKFHRDIVLYVIYLKKGSITLKELRENYQSIGYIRVKWTYQSKQINKITQCFNCQMFGHGSENCNIKTFCANCAGPHETSSCNSNIIKCANCNGEHKSSDPDCPSKSTYMELKQRYSKPKVQQAARNIRPSYPPLPPTYNYWSHTKPSYNVPPTNSNNSLFSTEELKSLTFELIDNLKNCRSKTDQFNVITSLAFKFLS